MRLVRTAIPEVLIVEPDRFADERGFFMELHNAARYAAVGIPGSFVQDNISSSCRGVLRGLHLQHPRSQGKLVTVLHGQVLDVGVDVRVGSPTFGQHVSVILDDVNRRQIWLPPGFAHGFLALSERAEIFYKCDAPYSPADEIAIRWDDPTLAIDWGTDHPTLSARDRRAPRLDDIRNLPVYQASSCVSSSLA